MEKKRSKKTKGKKRLQLRRAMLYRHQLGIHPAAKPAFWYHRRFQTPVRLKSKVGPVSQPLARPVIHASRVDGRHLLVSDFAVLQFFNDDDRTKCFQQLANLLSDEQIRVIAWRSVLSTERLQDDYPEILTAKYLVLKASLPTQLMPELLPHDPKTGRPLDMTVSSFARACRSSASTFNNFLPRLRSGGIASVGVGDIFKHQEEKE